MKYVLMENGITARVLIYYELLIHNIRYDED